METGIRKVNFNTVSRLILTVFQRVNLELELSCKSIDLMTQSKFDFFLSVFLFVTTISETLLPTIFAFLSQKASCLFYIRLVIM
jgi:hypothetical protein